MRARMFLCFFCQITEVSKESVILHRLGSEIQRFGFIIINELIRKIADHRRTVANEEVKTSYMYCTKIIKNLSLFYII